MKTTATLIQQALEQKAIDSMIAYERNLISEQKMGRALNDALQHYGNVEGHRSLKSNQLNDLDRIAFKYIKNDY